MLDTESWTVHSRAQKPKHLFHLIQIQLWLQIPTHWYPFSHGISQTSKQPREKDGVIFLLCRGSERWSICIGESGFEHSLLPLKLLNWAILRNDSPCNRFLCHDLERSKGENVSDHPCTQTGIRVPYFNRWKPDLKTIWVNPNNGNWIPTTKGIRKQNEYTRGLHSISSHQWG